MGEARDRCPYDLGGEGTSSYCPEHGPEQSRTTCPRCKGKGWVGPPRWLSWRMCSDCHGTGQIDPAPELPTWARDKDGRIRRGSIRLGPDTSEPTKRSRRLLDPAPERCSTCGGTADEPRHGRFMPMGTGLKPLSTTWLCPDPIHREPAGDGPPEPVGERARPHLYCDEADARIAELEAALTAEQQRREEAERERDLREKQRDDEQVMRLRAEAQAEVAKAPRCPTCKHSLAERNDHACPDPSHTRPWIDPESRDEGPWGGRAQDHVPAGGRERRQALLWRARDQLIDDAEIDNLDWLWDAATADRRWLLTSLDKTMWELQDAEARPSQAEQALEGADRLAELVRHHGKCPNCHGRGEFDHGAGVGRIEKCIPMDRADPPHRYCPCELCGGDGLAGSARAALSTYHHLRKGQGNG